MNRKLFDLRLESNDFACDQLIVVSLRGRETIGEPFWFELIVAMTRPQRLDTHKIAGAPVRLVFIEDGFEIRQIHGIIAEIDDYLSSEPLRLSYRLRLAPRATWLSLVTMQEVFIDTSVPEIFRRKLARLGLTDTDFQFRLTSKYADRDFVVQYRESDLAFISRLAEHHGISIFYEQSDDRDVIVFGDSPEAFKPIGDNDVLLYQSEPGSGPRRRFHRLEERTRLVPSLVQVYDYDYAHPELHLSSGCELPRGSGGGVIEYAPNFKTADEGSQLATIRAQERLVQQHQLVGHSSHTGLATGATCKLCDHPLLPEIHVLLIDIQHEAHLGFPDQPNDAVHVYSNEFRAVFAEQVYRPPRKTPRPRIAGVVSAIVEGEGKYARIDADGRYTVRLMFDCTTTEPPSSKPVRMAQPHVGPGYGMHFPLRAGMEVLVSFVDGDPDRPIIIGAVPNAITPSPVTQTNASAHRISTKTGAFIEIDE